MGQSVNPPTATAGQAGADWRLPGPVRAVTFIPSGTGPAGARILTTESISIEQPIYISFRILANCFVRPSHLSPLTRRRGRVGATRNSVAEASRVQLPALFGRALYNFAGCRFDHKMILAFTRNQQLTHAS